MRQPQDVIEKGSGAVGSKVPNEGGTLYFDIESVPQAQVPITEIVEVLTEFHFEQIGH